MDARVDPSPEAKRRARFCSKDRAAAADEARAAAPLCRLHDLERRDLDLALELVERHPPLEVRNALHAATALNRGIRLVLGTDRDFDAVGELMRIDPADETAVDRLLG